MKRITLKSEDIDGKINELLKYINQLAPRITNTANVYTPPKCFSGFANAPIDGILHREMFTLAGTLNQVLIQITGYDDSFSGTNITVEVQQSGANTVKTIKCGRNLVKLDLDVGISAGSKLIIKQDGEEPIRDIWIAGSYSIMMSLNTLHEIIWEELEKSDEGI